MVSQNKLTQKEAIQGYAIRDLPSADIQPFANYYNVKTGKVFPNLPADAYSVKHYSSRGLRLGIPPQNIVYDTIEVDNNDNDVLALLKSMQAEIKSLKAQLNGEIIEVEQVVKEPVQLKMF